MAGITAAYRRLAKYPAAIIAGVTSLIAVLGVAWAIDAIAQHFGPKESLGFGVLVVGLVFLVVPFLFVLSFTVLVNVHHPTSWRSPTIALVVCAAMLAALDYLNYMSVAAAVMGWLCGLVLVTPRIRSHGQA